MVWTTQLYSQNLYVKVIVLFVLILYIYPSYITADGIFLYKENGYGGEPIVNDLKAYDDGMVLVKLAWSNNSGACDDKLYDTLSLRIIYPNGTAIKKDIKLEGVVQPDNYCTTEYELIRMNQILVIYKENFNSTHKYVSGMIIDYDNNILNKTYFRLIPSVNSLSLTLNIYKEKGFIIFDELPENIEIPAISWQQYRIDPNGTFIELTSGKFELNINEYQWYSNIFSSLMISTVNEVYTYTYLLTSPKIYEGGLVNDLLIAAVLINYNKSESATVLLYHNHLQNVSALGTSLFCNIEYVGVGQYCTLVDFESTILSTLRINFLSSGSVVSLNTNIVTFTGSILTQLSMNLKSLPYGGFLMSTTNTDNSIRVNFFNENGTVDNHYKDIGNARELHDSSKILILPNNTLLIPLSRLDNNTWALSVIDAPKYTDRNTEYFNTNINSTFPKINDFLEFSDITNISINFYDPIKLSDGKLSIYYQPSGQGKILRQSTSCTITTAKCMLENDDKKVTVTVLDSVLSESGGNYFIEVDNNFVKDRVYEEPLLGIKENIWIFTIKVREIQYPIISSISGLLRLNVEGTDKISRSTNERNEFFNALLDELADLILIPRERLSKDSKEQIDPDSKDGRLLISITIHKGKDHSEKDADSVVHDLNNMMTNSEQTLIGQGSFTKYLDSTFGFKPKPNYWQEYKFKLLGAFLAIIILVALYIFARLKYKEGRNFAIFQFALIIFDFIMDILFIRSNASDFQNLYIPSLIFFTLPVASNTILAFLIITKENAKSDSKFSEWFNKNLKLASIFTILAGADIEILNLLHSNLAGLEIFNAPLSESAEHKVFWGSLLNIFIEDVPQLIIQILYRGYSITYDIIPILNLISSAINLTVNIVGRSYQAIKNIQDKIKRNTDDNP